MWLVGTPVINARAELLSFQDFSPLHPGMLKAIRVSIMATTLSNITLSNITLSPDDNNKWYLFCPAKPSYKMGVRLLAKTDL